MYNMYRAKVALFGHIDGALRSDIYGHLVYGSGVTWDVFLSRVLHNKLSTIFLRCSRFTFWLARSESLRFSTYASYRMVTSVSTFKGKFLLDG